MGRLAIAGAGSAAFLNKLLSVDVPGLRVGRARYNVICNENGGIIDDCIVYRKAQDRFLLIPNAANTPRVTGWLEQWMPSDNSVTMQDVTMQYAMIAVQGPKALDALSALASDDISGVRPFAYAETRIAGVEAMAARTGYTGEDGFEVILPSENAADLWKQLMERGAAACGLGARDVLRLEAGLLLHGNDMDETTNPYEAGLDRFVSPDRDGYVARDALMAARDGGVGRKLVAFDMVGRGIPRHGYGILFGTETVGQVTSGGHSPTLDRSIGLGYVEMRCSEPGTRLQIDIRGRLTEANVTTLPFYSRRRN
jgi:aminomethyltransferase